MPLMISIASAQKVNSPTAAAPGAPAATSAPAEFASVQSASSPPAPAVAPAKPAITPVTPISTTAEVPVVQMMMAPKTQWYEGSGLLTAGTALVAVVIGYFSLQKSTKKQIDASALRSKEQFDHAIKEAAKEREHAATQAQLDRKMEARQELYAQLVSDFIAVQGMLGRMPRVDMDADSKFSEPLLVMGATVNKTWLLSEVDTAFQVRELYSMVNEEFLALMKHVEPLQELKRGIKQNKAALELAREQRKQVHTIHAAKERKIAGSEFASQILNDASLGWAYQAVDKVISAQLGEMQAREKLHQQMVAVYTRHLVNLQPPILDKVNLIMAMGRKELGIEGDTTALNAQSHDMTIRAQRALAGFFEDDEMHDTLQTTPPA